MNIIFHFCDTSPFGPLNDVNIFHNAITGQNFRALQQV